MGKTISIAVDAMGSDNGPQAIIEGALAYLKDHEGNGVKLYIIGKKEILDDTWAAIKVKPGVSVDLVYADEIVEMHEPVPKGIKKRNSSIASAFKMHKEGTVDAVVSAGNTGVCMATAIRLLGRLEGVFRPAIAALFPTVGDKDVVLLDVGANVDSPPQNLVQFALMGSIYAAYMNKLNRPTIGLLSIGAEKVKGNESTLQAFAMLEESSVNFIGNIEGHDLLAGKADVVVSDGFVGNIMLKFAESIKGFLVTRTKRQISSNLFSRIGATLMAPFLKRLSNTFDASKYGGAPLLGINGVAIIAHGSSNPRAIKNAIRVAEKMVKVSVNDRIRTTLRGANMLEKAK